MSDRERWNGKYAQRKLSLPVQADDWLIKAVDTITDSCPVHKAAKRALDVACGLGQNSIWLTQHGWEVDGVDVSPAGLALAQQQATQLECAVNWIEADLDDWLPTSQSYDLAIVFRFLDRITVPRIVNAGLRSGSWLIYETFAAGQLDRPDSHIRNPQFALLPGELPTLFPEFEVITFREDTLEDRTVQRLLARRR
ncbi:MAG: class I SAM-dependent methyltransferase [Rhodopirellula sp.]|nr:class I SAM-dependent methyltransferase [Rhodopirellula sp.]